MSIKEFWEDDPDLFWAYRFSYINKKEREQEEINFKCWLQGGYFCDAVSVALSNAFGDRKVQYCNKPYELNSSEKSQREKQEKNALDEQLKARALQIQALLKGKQDG